MPEYALPDAYPLAILADIAATVGLFVWLKRKNWM
jgi:Mg2+ and Co2+ transporter CorA